MPGIVSSQSRQQVVQTVGRLCQRLGLPRSSGQIYGLLFSSAEPLSLDDMVEALGMSKASASIGTRQLMSWGLIRQAWKPGERRDFFEAVTDPVAVIQGALADVVRPYLAASRKRLQTILTELEADREQGVLTDEESRIFIERLQKLDRFHTRIQELLPFIEKMV